MWEPDIPTNGLFHTYIMWLPISSREAVASSTLSEIKNEALEDDFICEIKRKIATKDNSLSEVYSLCDNVLLYSERVVIPKKLQKRILKDFHGGHPGKNRMKSLMRNYVYWPAMDKDIMEMIKTCRGCALAAKAPPTTFKPWPKTEQPWSRIHIDFAGPIDDYYYLIVVDSYTKWPVVLRCKRPTTAVTISFLHELCEIWSSGLRCQRQWHTFYFSRI